MTPWTVAGKAPLSIEFSRQEYWSGFPFLSSEDLPNPGIEPRSSTGQADSLLSEIPWTHSVQFSSVAQSCPTLCNPMNCSTPASLSITNTQSPPKPMSIELVMPSNHLILCRPLLLLPSIFPIIRVFSNESALHIRWPKYWSFSFSIRPSNEHPGLISFRMNWLDLQQPKRLSRVFSNNTVQKHQFFSAQLS